AGGHRLFYPLGKWPDVIRCPKTEEVNNEQKNYDDVINKQLFAKNCAGDGHELINSLLMRFERGLSLVPSDPDINNLCDISLFDHLKLTAVIAAAMYCYFRDKGIDDFRRVCFTEAEKTREDKIFLLVSCDLSGIQKFIVYIHDKQQGSTEIAAGQILLP
ncbi:MAG: hypothetical protein N3A57_05955, partial [Negativicutes bacterium]|nr:hypothetical protein [Negativicutes bacterium]